MKNAIKTWIHFSLMSFVGSFCWSQQTIKTSLVHNQLTRTYSYYLPANQVPGKKLPLVFNLHGYGSNGDQQEFYGDFRKIADTAGFIVVHPDGTVYPQSGLRFWNVGLVGQSPVDDIGFIHAIIDTLSEKYTIDPERIYSCGMSNGGFMSYHLACNSHRFAAIASVTGSMTAVTEITCNNASPMPILEIHGTADAVVNYNGSAGILSIPEVLNFWVRKNGLDSSQLSIILVPDLNPSDGATAEHHWYQGSHDVEHYKVINGGHTWPGSPFVIGTTCQDFNASDVIWNFFNKYKRTTVSTAEPKRLDFAIRSNPVRDYLHISIRNDKHTTLSFQILNVQGRVIMEGKYQQGQHGIPVQNLDPGLYIVSIASKGYSHCIKFIKA